MIPSQKEQIYIVFTDPQVSYLLERVLRSNGFDVVAFTERTATEKALNSLEKKNIPALVIISDKLKDGTGLDFARSLATSVPTLPVILFVSQDSHELLKSAMRLGITDYLCLPLRTEEILAAVQNSIRIAHGRREWTIRNDRHVTASLQRQVSELETVVRLGRSITATLDPDAVLSAIVEAAVELTGAEEGSLLLVDDVTGELYMRASRNFQEQFARTFRLPVQDSLAGKVIQTGRPVLLDQNTPQKIKTAYLVKRLLYVPLQVHDRVFGVLGVDNRQKTSPFTDRHVQVVTALAEFAVIAIENSHLYHKALADRNKLETILTSIQDGVIVLDKDGRIILVNQTACQTFNLEAGSLTGKTAAEVFSHPDLLDLVNAQRETTYDRVEISIEDGRIFNAQLTPIPEVGAAITLNDITSLKKLDRIKTDFVNTVSHDLRSPLTAILGYVELIDRVGPINETQAEFISRIQASVHNITNLVDDLLNLGRIEAGFDTRKEMVQVDQIIQQALDESAGRAEDKKQKLVVDLPDHLSPLFGNPVQLLQMIENLLDNAIKYTPDEGAIKVSGRTEGNQIILQIIDTGIGIPVVDLPYIFDKFYRASNIDLDQDGTGLGLSIVKSIVENHQGRIWVDSVINKGTKFTVILPLEVDQDQP